MNIEQFLRHNTKVLEDLGIGTARLDVLVLLEDCLNTNRTQLLAHPEQILTNEQMKRLNSLTSRRAKHEPLAYIRGKTEFYGREFIITKNVLEPRPESEMMIEMLVRLRGLSKNFYAADVGTGSGAIGITIKLEFPNANVDLIEIDSKALAVAKRNVAKHDVGVRLIQADLLSSSKQTYDVLLANLPYVPEDFHINQAAGAEPKIAIFGGKDGLDIYRRYFTQLKSAAKQPLYVLTESMPPQHNVLAEIAETSGFCLSKTDDFIQLFIRA